jgi:transposase
MTKTEMHKRHNRSNGQRKRRIRELIRIIARLKRQIAELERQVELYSGGVPRYPRLKKAA